MEKSKKSVALPGVETRTVHLVANRYSAYTVQAARRFGKVLVITIHS